MTASPPELGGNMGGALVIVTKSGTNRFSGEAFEFFRDKSLNAMNVFERTRPSRPFSTPNAM